MGITSQNIKVRWQNGRGYFKCKVFKRAIDKYGWDNFQHNIIASNLGEKIGKLWRGKTIPQNVRNNMSKSHIGKKNTMKHNDNIRKSKLGNTNGNKSVLQLDLDGNIIRKYVSAVEAAKNIGSIPNSVTRCCRGEVKTLHKFRFVYEKDYKEIIE